MIFDGENIFENSCVEYTPFRYNFLRERFAKLRQQEALLQDALKKGAISEADSWPSVWNAISKSPLFNLIRAKFQLEFTEAELIWMAHNVSEDCRGRETSLGYRRKSTNSGPSKQISLWEAEDDEEDIEFEEVAA